LKVLSKEEERVIAALEEQFPPDGPCSDALDALSRRARPAEEKGSALGRLAPAMTCLAVGVALLVSARQTWSLVRMSNFSGLASASITQAFSVIGLSMVLGCVVLLCLARRRARPFDRPGAGLMPPGR
jgi:hypothetical protein